MDLFHLVYANSLSGQAIAKEEVGTECILTSEVLQDLTIRLNIRQDPYVWVGGIYAKNNLIAPFTLGVSSGYGSSYWSIPSKERSSAEAIKFAGHTPSRAIATVARPQNTRYLFPGLGSAMYYGPPELPDLRNKQYPIVGVTVKGLEIVRAGEGFWKIGLSCIDRFVF